MVTIARVYFATVSECHAYIEDLKNNGGITANGIGYRDRHLTADPDGLNWYVEYFSKIR